MKPIIVLAAAVAALATAPAAIAQTRTITVDTPNFYGERVWTRDREAGTHTFDSTLYRKYDGAQATRHRESQRTENGRIVSGTHTNFSGQTRSFEGERQRQGNRYRSRGTATGFNGRTYEYRAQGHRGPNGIHRRQRVQNSDGQTVAGRNVHVHRDGNTVTRRVTAGRRGQGVRRTTTRRTVRRRGR